MSVKWAPADTCEKIYEILWCLFIMPGRKKIPSCNIIKFFLISTLTRIVIIPYITFKWTWYIFSSNANKICLRNKTYLYYFSINCGFVGRQNKFVVGKHLSMRVPLPLKMIMIRAWRAFNWNIHYKVYVSFGNSKTISITIAHVISQSNVPLWLKPLIHPEFHIPHN